MMKKSAITALAEVRERILAYGPLTESTTCEEIARFAVDHVIAEMENLVQREARECTTPTRTRRHYSCDVRPNPLLARAPGWSGITLCGEVAISEELANWEVEVRRLKRSLVNVAGLTVCGRCEASIAAHGIKIEGRDVVSVGKEG